MYLKNKPDKPKTSKYVPMTEKEKNEEEIRDRRLRLRIFIKFLFR